MSDEPTEGAAAPGGQHDTNAGLADTAGPITGTVPIGEEANDAPDTREVGADGNPLETPDATGVEVTETEPIAGTGESTDANEG